jgi:hypothetical protein
MTAELLAFQRYQLQFTSHIRDPEKNRRPTDVPANRMRVYTEIVFNNLESSIAACFPVCKKTLGPRAWEKLVRGFFIDHQSHSPLFRQIPEEFLRYLDSLGLHNLDLGSPDQLSQQAGRLPPYLKNLAHYEWVELALASADVSVDMDIVDSEGDLLEGQLVLAPALAVLSYEYPVQRISPHYKPIEPLSPPVHLLVFRNTEDNVRFIEVNQITSRLLMIIQAEALTGRDALQLLATEMAHPDPQALVRFGHSIFMDLKTQGVILGIRADIRDNI